MRRGRACILGASGVHAMPLLTRRSSASVLTLLFLAGTVGPVAQNRPGAAQNRGDSVEWLNVGGDKGSTRYSPLRQIDGTNAGQLRIAWRRPGIADELRAKYPEVRSGTNRSTPLLINGVLYGPNAVGLVEAFDP